jgi:hypothetical protein
MLEYFGVVLYLVQLGVEFQADLRTSLRGELDHVCVEHDVPLVFVQVVVVAFADSRTSYGRPEQLACQLDLVLFLLETLE